MHAYISFLFCAIDLAACNMAEQQLDYCKVFVGVCGKHCQITVDSMAQEFTQQVRSRLLMFKGSVTQDGLI